MEGGAYSSQSAASSVTLTCGTDNQGNHFLLDKLMTTKFPLGVVLMELACQLSLRRACLHARWIPRLENEEADALTNEALQLQCTCRVKCCEHEKDTSLRNVGSLLRRVGALFFGVNSILFRLLASGPASAICRLRGLSFNSHQTN